MPLTRPLLFAAAATCTAFTPLLATPGQAEDTAPHDPRTTLNLSAEVRQSATQDRLQATLSYEAQGKSAAEVQARINENMQKARTLYSKVPTVKATSGGYHVWRQPPPESPEKPLSADERDKRTTWVGSQQLILDGTNPSELLKLVAPLQQQGFAVQGLNYYLSPKAADSIRDSLLEEGLATLRQRAERTAKALGVQGVQFSRIDVNTGGGPIYPMARSDMAMMAKAPMAEAMPEPVVQAGETDVVLTISAEVKLGPTPK